MGRRTVLADRLVMTTAEKTAYEAFVTRNPYSGGSAIQRGFIAGYRAAQNSRKTPAEEVDPWTPA